MVHALERRLKICAEVRMRVHHNLAGQLRAAGKSAVIYSKPQAVAVPQLAEPRTSRMRRSTRDASTRPQAAEMAQRGSRQPRRGQPPHGLGPLRLTNIIH